MSKGSRILVLAAALALGLVYVLPVWRIDLDAPQYPEGLGMVIRINDIAGAKEHDLRNINNLNHYIGMKRIEPESIRELDVMPAIVGVLLALGVVTAAVGRRKGLYAFTALFLAFAVAGMADFWKWEFDYGHDLDQEHAIIKIPGMSYQPPLIGSRQILNFRAHSWPAPGGWILIAAGALFSFVAVREVRDGRRGPRRVAILDPDPPGRSAPVDVPGAAAAPILVLALAATVAAGSCADPHPREISWGTDACEACRMSLADDGHAAQAVTRTGRTYTFDSIECMAGWLRDFDDASTVHSLWVTDFAHRPAMIRADAAYFLHTPGLPSPMGLGLTAFSARADRDEALRRFGGATLDWEGARALVAERWPEGRPGDGMGAHGGHAETLAPPS